MKANVIQVAAFNLECLIIIISICETRIRCLIYRNIECNFACKTYVRKNTTEVNPYNCHSEISFVTQTLDEEPPISTFVRQQAPKLSRYVFNVSNIKKLYREFNRMKLF